MSKERKYRHEYKFFIDERQRAVLFYRLKNLVSLDSHIEAQGSYWIRSVYFDDYKDTCYLENDAGVDVRSKYRIRIYNAEDNRITLERKSKKNGMTCKESAALTRKECEQILNGIPLAMVAENGEPRPELIRQFSVLMLTRNLRAKNVIEYERIPFVCKEGNVRITFDRNITSALDVEHFFEKDLRRYPILPSGQQILEVKFDEFLPEYIKSNLETGKLSQTSFSKYYLGRKYTLAGVGGRLR